MVKSKQAEGEPFAAEIRIPAEVDGQDNLGLVEREVRARGFTGDYAVVANEDHPDGGRLVKVEGK